MKSKFKNIVLSLQGPGILSPIIEIPYSSCGSPDLSPDRVLKPVSISEKVFSPRSKTLRLKKLEKKNITRRIKKNLAIKNKLNNEMIFSVSNTDSSEIYYQNKLQIRKLIPNLKEKSIKKYEFISSSPKQVKVMYNNRTKSGNNKNLPNNFKDLKNSANKDINLLLKSNEFCHNSINSIKKGSNGLNSINQYETKSKLKTNTETVSKELKGLAKTMIFKHF